MARKTTFLSLQNNQLEMNKGAYQHTRDNDGAEYDRIIITEHTKRFVNTLHIYACDNIYTCT